MSRIDRIIQNPQYVDTLKRLQVLETDRIFCRHDISHFMSVARLMWIAVLEQQLPVDREVVYAAALLHDIGRVAQVEHGIPHEQASAEFAQQILPDAGFNEEELREVTAAILSHREDCSVSELGKILYQADKRSRACWCCGASDLCNWPDEKKNKGIFR